MIWGFLRIHTFTKNDIPVHGPLVKGFMNILILSHILILIWSQWIKRRHLLREVAKIKSYFQVQNHWKPGQCTGEQAKGSMAGKLHTDTVFISPVYLLRPSQVWPCVNSFLGLHQWFYIHVKLKLLEKKKKRMLACFGVNNSVQK